MPGTSSISEVFGYFPLQQELLNIESVVFFLVLFFLMLAGMSDPESLQSRGRGKQPLIVAILASVGLFALFASDWGIERFHLALVVAVGMVLTRRGPVYAVCLFVAILILRPWEIMDKDELMGAMPRMFALLAFSSVLLFG